MSKSPHWPSGQPYPPMPRMPQTFADWVTDIFALAMGSFCAVCAVMLLLTL